MQHASMYAMQRTQVMHTLRGSNLHCATNMPSSMLPSAHVHPVLPPTSMYESLKHHALQTERCSFPIYFSMTVAQRSA